MVSPTLRRLAGSAYGPKYHSTTHFMGLSSKQLMRVAFQAAGFGAPLAVAAMLFTSGIPRVQRDILMLIPLVGPYTKKAEIDPNDNPF